MSLWSCVSGLAYRWWTILTTPLRQAVSIDHPRTRRRTYDMSFPNPVGAVMFGPKNLRYVLE